MTLYLAPLLGMALNPLVSGMDRVTEGFSFSKFLMVMSLGAIWLKISFSQVTKSRFIPKFQGFPFSLLVVSFLVQLSQDRSSLQKTDER